MAETAAAEAPVRIACIQIEPRIGEKPVNLRVTEAMIREAAAKGARLLVLPELCNSGYMFKSRAEAFELAEPAPSGESCDLWRRLAHELGLTLVAGICERDGNALYNSAVIYSNLENYKEAVRVLDMAVGLYPQNKELLSLAGQTKYQSDDAAGAVTVLKKALEIDPTDETVHQFLFLSYTKLKKQEESVAEYTVYKALSDGKQKVGPALKIWVDSAGNRLGAQQQITKTVGTEGYPDEVRTYPDGDKTLECFFYWGKGKAITFLNGQHFSQLAFPPKKS